MSAVSNQEPPFLSLPDELIAEIFKLCNLSDHFNLALTCHRLANGGAAILARHKTAYREYGTVTDWLPLTIPTVLQKAIEDPYVAWNIRVIEIYGTRYGWEYWGSFRSEPPPTVNVFASPPLEDVESETFQGGETYHDFRWRQVFEKPPNTELWHEEQVDDDLTEDCMTYAMWATKRRDEYQESIIQRYLPNYVDLLVRYGHISDNRIEIAREQLLEGNDSLLKVLLILLCPRLIALKHASGKDDVRDSSKWCV